MSEVKDREQKKKL